MPKDCYQDGMGWGWGRGLCRRSVRMPMGHARQISAVKNTSETLVFPAFESVSKVETRLKMLRDV